MKPIALLSLVVILVFSLTQRNRTFNNSDYCSCDTTQALNAIDDPEFNKLLPYDSDEFLADSLYSLSKEENRRLWYRDIESPDSTKFTKYWNSYLPNNYHAQHLDFIEFYRNKPEVEIAFQFGPNSDLWAYHIFVIRKLDCCYLVTRSYFRHARFTYKAYSIIDQQKVDRLYEVLDPINKQPIDSASWNFQGYFTDNRNDSYFFIDFENERDENGRKFKKEIIELFDFVDQEISWTVTYK